MKWYENRYVQALGVAVATGIVAAAAVYLSTMTDGLDMRHTVKVVGTAFLGPFAVLVSVLPKITDIITPTVRIESNQPIAVKANEPTHPHTVETSASVTDLTLSSSWPPPPVPVPSPPTRPPDDKLR